MILSMATAALLSEDIQLAHFHRVAVSKAKLTPTRSTEFCLDPPRSSQLIRCSSLCISQLWCDLWCQNTPTAHCFISDMIVMPDYNETDMNDALMCYTRRPKDLATGASIQASSIHASFPLRVEGNLVDGIYDRQTMDQCFLTSTLETNHWFVLDLKQNVRFRIIKLTAQPKGSLVVVGYLGNLEVRVGQSAPDTPGNFESYAYFGSFTGPATNYSQEIAIEVHAPVRARYISLQKMGVDRIQICHLEVY